MRAGFTHAFHAGITKQEHNITRGDPLEAGPPKRAPDSTAPSVRPSPPAASRRVEDVGWKSMDRPGREALLKTARRREVDVVVVWRSGSGGRPCGGFLRPANDPVRSLPNGPCRQEWPWPDGYPASL